MILVWIPVSILILYALLNLIYKRLWKKGLSLSLAFEEKDAAEGDTATLVETVTNEKFLPLPVLKISFKMDRGLVIDEDRNVSVSDMTNVVEYFGLSAFEQVKRRQPVRALKRGCYLIKSADCVLPAIPRSPRRPLSCSCPLSSIPGKRLTSPAGSWERSSPEDASTRMSFPSGALGNMSPAMPCLQSTGRLRPRQEAIWSTCGIIPAVRSCGSF